MTIQSWSDEELAKLHADVDTFLEQFERLYVGGDPEKIYRCGLCIFQLIHVPIHIKWFGSIRVGSQAPVERAIGEASHKIHSKKNPFADLSHIIVEKEVIRIIQLYYPELADATPAWRNGRAHTTRRVFQNLKFSKAHAASKNGKAHIASIGRLFGLQSLTSGFPDLLGSNYSLQCYGKLQLETGQTLRSRVSEGLSETTARCYRWFEVRVSFLSKSTPSHALIQSKTSNSDLSSAFGEALAFYTLRVPHGTTPPVTKTVMVYRPLTQLEQPFRTVIRGKWADDDSVLAMEVGNVQDVVGVWEAESKYVYMLRKHPSLLSLMPSERGLVDSRDSVDDSHDE